MICVIFETLNLHCLVPMFVYFISGVDQQHVRKSLIDNEPVMEQVVQLQPTTFGLYGSTAELTLKTFLYDYAFLSVCMNGLLFYMSYLLKKGMKQTKSSVSAATFQMQLMLFKNLSYQFTAVRHGFINTG